VKIRGGCLTAAGAIGRTSAAVALAGLVLAGGGGAHPAGATTREAPAPPPAASRPVSPAAPRGAAPARPAPPPRVTVRILVVHLDDPQRTMRVAGHAQARAFATVLRIPEGIPGPLPLIVFGHGYAVTPAPYAPLLDAWTRAGYVVAAPVFPLENAGAPGGPDERDLVNQPGDMSLVISALLDPGDPATAAVAGRIDGRHVAVAGQSDGGDTALAAAYDGADRDPRIAAALILSGAEDPFAAPFAMPPTGPALLAVQGTADTINPPAMTDAFFTPAGAPKYLLRLIGAGHLPPYTEPGPELSAVRRVTVTVVACSFRRSSTV